MHDSPERRASYSDLEAVPAHLVAEIIDGRLITHPRPSPRLATTQAALGAILGSPYQFAEGGPGGWIFSDEPELRLGPHILVPDIAGWRREKLREPRDTAWIETPPDWVCEIISAATERYDRRAKPRIYAEFEVAHLWLVDPASRRLETFERVGSGWQAGPAFGRTAEVLAPPFVEHRFSLGLLWPFDTAAVRKG